MWKGKLDEAKVRRLNCRREGGGWGEVGRGGQRLCVRNAFVSFL